MNATFPSLGTETFITFLPSSGTSGEGLFVIEKSLVWEEAGSLYVRVCVPVCVHVNFVSARAVDTLKALGFLY